MHLLHLSPSLSSLGVPSSSFPSLPHPLSQKHILPLRSVEINATSGELWLCFVVLHLKLCHVFFIKDFKTLLWSDINYTFSLLSHLWHLSMKILRLWFFNIQDELYPQSAQHLESETIYLSEKDFKEQKRGKGAFFLFYCVCKKCWIKNVNMLFAKPRKIRVQRNYVVKNKNFKIWKQDI